MYYRNTNEAKKEYVKSEFVNNTSKEIRINANASGVATISGATPNVRKTTSNVLGKSTQKKLLGDKKAVKNTYGIKKKSMIQSVKEKTKGKLKASTKEAVKKSPKEMIKNLARVNRLQDLLTSKDLSSHNDILNGIGKKGAQLAVNTVIIIVKMIIKAAMKILGLIFSLLGAFIVCAISLIALLVVLVGGGNKTSSDGMSGNNNSEIVASQLSEPRLTADGILTNAWYVGDINPFVPAGYGVVRHGIDNYGNHVTYYGNCTAYAWGRWGEVLGYAPALPTGNAGTWYDTNVQRGTYDYGQTAKAGAIACWAYRSGGAGHVAVVEEIHSDGTIVMSESQYNGGVRRDIGNLFYTRTFPNEQAVHDLWIFKGYIYLPIDMED